MPFQHQKSKILEERGTAPFHRGIEEVPLPTPHTAHVLRFDPSADFEQFELSTGFLWCQRIFGKPSGRPATGGRLSVNISSIKEVDV